MTKADTRAALAQWARESGCRLAVLFGSAADDRAETPRDVDVALDYAEMPDAASRLAIVSELQELVDPRTIDVVFLHRDTSPVLLFEVFRGGRVLFEAEPGLFIRGAVRAAALYDDAWPFRRALRKSLREGVSS